MIYEAAKAVGTEPKGDAKKAIAYSKEFGNLFKDTDEANNANALAGANRPVHTVSGADILAAIGEVKDISKGADDIANAKNAYEIAIANKNNGNATHVQANASVIAAGLALKAMAKDGKLATNANAPHEGINSVLSIAVSETVNEIIFTIRRTIDKCLKNVSDCIKSDSTNELKAK
ncbi:Variable major outer membrane lipoprotein (plasmid) [Borrelia coriaceae ATCC 43381]|uniref:Variable large protein n=1 Tax=Borrelia coriaceae ATCC 43381 TaxID=1408429 RepID=W5SY43_9SPIR|nr:Variable major outer membrane lipoprotein [Borrelia coriaceae ATCC 43381]